MNDGETLWDTTATSEPFPPLLGLVSADVAVVGAGYTGLSAALHLAQSGRRVVVVEAQAVGHGGSGRNVGLVNAGLWVLPSQIRRRLGATYGERLIAGLSAAPDLVFELIDRLRIRCEAVRNGTLHCAVGEAGLRDMRVREREWQERGAPVQLLDAAAARELIGSHAYRGALLDRRAGTLQPLAFARGLARGAREAGCLIFERSPVLRTFDHAKGWSLYTPGGEVRALQVIVATNAYSREAYEHIAAELVRFPYFNVATEILPDTLRASILPQRHGIWDSRRILSSARTDEAGRLIFGSIGALGGIAGQVHESWARRSLERLFPQLRGVRFEHRWHGWIGTTRDAVPKFHRLARQVYSISGYNGRGIAPGTFFGRQLALLVTGRLPEDGLVLPMCALKGAVLRRGREMFFDMGSSVAHALGARGLR
jgi:glycine/D-amino acid oxidase-like deaminating enzyme